MRKQQKVILYAVGLPIARRLAVVLLFNDNLFEFKSSKLKEPHCFKRERLHHSLFAGISHEYCTELVLFENSETLLRHLAHLKKKRLYGKQ